jgi:hypothetical protein
MYARFPQREVCAFLLKIVDTRFQKGVEQGSRTTTNRNNAQRLGSRISLFDKKNSRLERDLRC